jgi:hypothetical protein
MLGQKTEFRASLTGKAEVIYPETADDRDRMLGSCTVGLDLPSQQGYNVFSDRRMALYGSNNMSIISSETDWIPVGADWTVIRKESDIRSSPSKFYKSHLRLEDYFPKAIEIIFS